MPIFPHIINVTTCKAHVAWFCYVTCGFFREGIIFIYGCRYIAYSFIEHAVEVETCTYKTIIAYLIVNSLVRNIIACFLCYP